MSSDPPDSEHFVSALARGLAVIEAFGSGREALTLSEVARRADISRAAARRLLLTNGRISRACLGHKSEISEIPPSCSPSISSMQL